LLQKNLGELFPGIEKSEILIPPTQFYRPADMVLPLPDLLTMAAICHYVAPHRIFEIGTYKGSCTLLMAINTPAETKIRTLDLDEEGVRREGPWFEVGVDYKNHPAAAKIQQHRAYSHEFDYAPFAGQMDLVFVDANHSYPHVKADTEKAFLMARSGGIIVWDDYVWGDYPECVGVARRLNELAQDKEILHIANTRLALHFVP
jgi:predicted O-methyltransferase YrrM